jgi:flavin-binding protein dodecin
VFSVFQNQNCIFHSEEKNYGLERSGLLITLGDHYDMMTHVAKIIEIIGSSEKGWSEAAQAALDEAKKTIKGITGLEVEDITAKVDPNTGNITQYRVSVKIAFGVEHS